MRWTRAALYFRTMCARLLVAALLIVSFAPRAAGNAPEGVPRELARERAAEISELRYRLSFSLTSGAPSTAGTEEIRFRLRSAAFPLLLDFRGGALVSLSVNGVPVAVRPENGHLELPASSLRPGNNVVHVQFTAQVGPAGKAITRYEDRDDHAEYLYTLFVPMDASMAFPCFDQPDLKARFALEVTAPEHWTVISNMPAAGASPATAGQRRTRFAETRPISTYLFAFAAGPFRKLDGAAGAPALYVRQSKFASAQSEAPEVQRTTAQGMAYLSNFFAQPFPFPKYDMVLIPGFAYGGMEHAGVTFLREESVLFRVAPTNTDRLNRDLLVLHELTHQWFGDLVTMRWFDDLWLKEGFAEYMAYQTLASLKPDENIWKRFYEANKPPAYAIDSTQGTTPIYQDISNLLDAKSAYGAIVYDKAPGVLKQLAFVLGPEHFRDGLRLYLKEHSYGNAEWTDLVRDFERVSGTPLDHWAEMWIRHRGMPQVDVSWSCDGNRLSRLSLSQKDVLGTDDVWPIAAQVLLDYGPDKPVRIRTELAQRSVELPVTGKSCPRFVFANDQDYAYGRFLLDARSQTVVMEQIGAMPDVFQRSLLWGSLWDSVRQADLAPRDYVNLAVKLLPAERDESLTQSVLAHATTALHRYLSDDARNEMLSALESLAANQMAQSPDLGLRIVWFRGFVRLAKTPSGLAKLKALLNGQLSIPDVDLRPLDRWNLVTALIASGDPEADALLNSEKQTDRSGDGEEYAYVAEAARPNAGAKQQYFDDYLHNVSRPEDWVEQSLGAFNYWNQSQLTEPYLKPALEALPQIKGDRKIFFVLDWLAAFLGGQQSPAARERVYEYLKTATMDQDLRLKILQEVDELDRTVAIRQKFPQ
jgi:aminopeptidase N